VTGPTPADPRALLDLAVEACRAAGEVTRAISRRGRFGVRTKSTADDLVTDADGASERTILELLEAARPNDGVVSEEGAARDSTTGLTWIMDPLDGTTNFVYGRPRWAVSIACRDAGGELVACTLDVPSGETFTAVRGGGAFLDDEPIRVNDVERLDQALIGTGFSPDPELRRLQGAMVGALMARVRDVRRPGSPCLDLADVASGRLDGFFEVLPGPWDWAAGSLLVREAGGLLTVDGGPLGRPQVIAAGPRLAPLLRRLLTDGLSEVSGGAG
jgi:fructose-1,6-bisphosphatase/inositol monophosphatase family enzyme